MVAIKRSPLPKDILQTIGQFVIEWAEFEAFLTLQLRVLLAIRPARDGFAEHMRHEFVRRFRMYNEILPELISDPKALKWATRIQGRIGKDMDNRQWLAHGFLEDYDSGWLSQAMHKPGIIPDEPTRHVTRDQLRRQLAHFQKTYEEFAAFSDAVVWPIFEPLIRKR